MTDRSESNILRMCCADREELQSVFFDANSSAIGQKNNAQTTRSRARDSLNNAFQAGLAARDFSNAEKSHPAP